MTPILWSYSDLVAATGGQLHGSPSVAVRGLSIDSRTVRPGDAFLAIRGERFDGHDFAAAALEAGAAVAIVAADKLAGLNGRGPCLAVADPMAALEALARAARARSPARIVGVTGSVGKTGTKEMLRLALARSGPTHASAASYNNHWGVPLTLARLGPEAAYAVVEMGMNHAGEITPLSGMTRPHVAIVTTVGPVHIEFFPSVDAIAEAKAEIFSGVEPGGAAVIHRDIPQYEILRARAAARGLRVVSFGRHVLADARVLDSHVAPDLSTVSATILGVPATYRVGAPGRHFIDNSLAVLAAVSLLGADLALAALALADMRAPDGRGARHRLRLPHGGHVLIVDESYNAQPPSMAAALRLLGALQPGPGGRRIAILGDMLELGEGSAGYHRDLAPVIEEARIDRVHAAGPQMRHLWEVLPGTRRGAYASHAAELESEVLDDVAAGDIVMVKGSLGSRMGPIVDAFKARYPAEAAASEEDAA